MQRNNPFDKLNGRQLRTALRHLKHTPLALDAAVLSAQARGHFQGHHKFHVESLPMGELLRLVRRNDINSFIAEEEIRYRVAREENIGLGGNCDGHLHQIY